jgi:pyruvate dehydrogenase E1 component alpha subunit
MHFFQAEVGNMGGHGIVGGQIPLGTGLAFSAWYKKTGGVAFTLFGDGALNQGSFNESLNLAGLWKLPCIYIVENNGMAMGTQVARSSSEKDLTERGAGYGMPARAFDGNDLDVVIAEFTEAVDRGRRGEGPTYFVANTYRFRGHSMSDAMKYRSKEEAEAAKQRDPILIYEKRLREKGLVTDEQIEAMTDEAKHTVDDAVKFADASQHPALAELYTDILAEKYPLQK